MQSGPCESKLLLVKKIFFIVFSESELKNRIFPKKELPGFQNIFYITTTQWFEP
jgi:hypothetical protein